MVKLCEGLDEVLPLAAEEDHSKHTQELILIKGKLQYYLGSKDEMGGLDGEPVHLEGSSRSYRNRDHIQGQP